MFHARNFHAGCMAETSVALKYMACGFSILEERYRTKEGEIDLVGEHDGKLYFIEVKKSKTHALAAGHIQPRHRRAPAEPGLGGAELAPVSD